MSAAPVAVLGGGIMGRGIVASLALAGHPVTVVEPADGSVLDRIATIVAAQTDEPASVMSRVTVGELEPAIAGAGIVIEAVPEDFALKTSVWTAIGAEAAPDAVLASNTSAFGIDDLAALVPHPERVLGMHWFNPAEVIPCVEVVLGTATAPAVADAVVALLNAAGKEPARVRSSPGFVANRIQFAMVREALLCLEEGLAAPEDIDRIVSGSFGVRLAALGPLANADLGGLDTYRSILEYLSGTLGERFAPPRVLDELVAAGRCGVKSGAGIAEYPGDAGPELARLRDERLRRILAARKDVTP